jgi:hypothetical protein
MGVAGQDESGGGMRAFRDVYILSIFPKIYGERFIKPWRLRLIFNTSHGKTAQKPA